MELLNKVYWTFLTEVAMDVLLSMIERFKKMQIQRWNNIRNCLPG